MDQQKTPCSPKRQELGLRDGTCLSKKELTNVAKAAHVVVKPSDKKKTMVNALSKKMTNKCGKNEICWLQSTGTSKYLSAYRPQKPKTWLKNPRTWLNTYDILYVMQQYEERYKSFKFLGVHPIDFEEKDSYGRCVGDNLCDLHIRQLQQKGYKKFALVLNLDDHNGNGYHWVAIYCCFDPKTMAARKGNFGIYYYDSVADPPDSHNKHNYTMKFMKKIHGQVNEVFGEKSSKKFQIKYNTVQRQFKNTECGMFSQVFIIQMLKNIKFDEVCTKMPKDDDVYKIRDTIYSPS